MNATEYATRRAFRKDWSAYDQQRGAGEKTGRLAGTLAGVAGAFKVAGKVARVLKPRKLPLRAAAAGLAAYGTYQGAKAVGGYVGRKIDEATARVFKGGLSGPSDKADWAREWIDRRHAKAKRQLLQHAVKRVGAADKGRRHLGIGESIKRRELQRTEKSTYQQKSENGGMPCTGTE